MLSVLLVSDWGWFGLGGALGLVAIIAWLYVWDHCVGPCFRYYKCCICRGCCVNVTHRWNIWWIRCWKDTAHCLWYFCCCQFWCCCPPSDKPDKEDAELDDYDVRIGVKDQEPVEEGCCDCLKICCACCESKPLLNVDRHMADCTLEELEDDFVNSGVMEDISIIVAIDFTRSNVFKGRRTFGGKNLHTIDHKMDDEADLTKIHNGNLNPYEKAILAAEYFLSTDEDFPLYFFGSAEASALGGCAHVKDCEDFVDLWQTYREYAETQELSGPGRFTPVLERAIARVRHLNRFHVLLYLTDGDVEDNEEFGLALAQASHDVPLVVVVVGIGDGPFGQIEQFDDHMPDNKRFDNLQFTSFEETVGTKVTGIAQKNEFFAHAFNEVPRQYRQCKRLQGYRAPMRRLGHFEEEISFELIKREEEAAAASRARQRKKPTYANGSVSARVTKLGSKTKKKKKPDPSAIRKAKRNASRTPKMEFDGAGGGGGEY